MTKTAAHKGLFLIAVAFLLLGGPRQLMACSKSGTPASDGPKVIASNPDSLSTTDCLKHAKDPVEPKPVSVEMPEPVQVPAPQQKQPVKNEGANNMSFNFLYYLFYKFSVSEFFRTPDFSETGGY